MVLSIFEVVIIILNYNDISYIWFWHVTCSTWAWSS